MNCQPHSTLNPLETAANTNEAINQLLGAISDPASTAASECGSAVSECFLQSVIGQVETVNYNQHGRVEHRAVDLKDLIVEEIASAGGRLSDVSQVNFLTHGDGSLDVRAMLDLVQKSPDQAIRDAVANVIYAGPTFGGTVAAELDVAFFRSSLLTEYSSDPWVQAVGANNTGGEFEAKVYGGGFEAYLRTHLTAILDAAFDRNEYDSFEDQIPNIPSPNEIEARVGAVITAIDDAFAAATGGSSLSDVDNVLQISVMPWFRSVLR